MYARVTHNLGTTAITYLLRCGHLYFFWELPQLAL